ncbi:MAG: S49 family peptidase, partial [Candidatus Woesearchaeota archaeon]
FIEEIAQNRNLKKKDVEKIATGMFYLGVEAKELGLVDELGGEDEVIGYIENKTGEKVNIVGYTKTTGFLSSLSQVMNGNSFYIGKGIGSSVFAKAKSADSLSIST